MYLHAHTCTIYVPTCTHTQIYTHVPAANTTHPYLHVCLCGHAYHTCVCVHVHSTRNTPVKKKAIDMEVQITEMSSSGGGTVYFACTNAIKCPSLERDLHLPVAS